jgi:hypothetical protein
MGHWAWGIGHGALSMGHWAWGMGHGALGMGQGCANLKVWAWGIGISPPLPHSPSPMPLGTRCYSLLTLLAPSYSRRWLCESGTR